MRAGCLPGRVAEGDASKAQRALLGAGGGAARLNAALRAREGGADRLEELLLRELDATLAAGLRPAAAIAPAVDPASGIVVHLGAGGAGGGAGLAAAATALELEEARLAAIREESARDWPAWRDAGNKGREVEEEGESAEPGEQGGGAVGRSESGAGQARAGPVEAAGKVGQEKGRERGGKVHRVAALRRGSRRDLLGRE